MHTDRESIGTRFYQDCGLEVVHINITGNANNDMDLVSRICNMVDVVKDIVALKGSENGSASDVSSSATKLSSNALVSVVEQIWMDACNYVS